MEARQDLIFATGRSDYPNQINNVLGFPYIFRGALDSRATCINEEMKVAAVRAIAELTKKPVPDVVNTAYDLRKLSFGRDYIIPKPLDPRLLTIVAPAVAKAAMESGVARKAITDWDAYDAQLRKLMGSDNKMLRRFFDAARSNPKRVVFTESNHVNMLKAAEMAVAEGICFPILLGNEEKIANIAAENHVDLTGIEIVNLRHDREEKRRTEFAKYLSQKRSRDGISYDEAYEKMYERNYFGMMMVETGQADALITGVYSKYNDTIKAAKDVIGIRDGRNTIAALQILNTKKGTLFLADTLFTRNPSTDDLVEITKLAHDGVKFFNHDPVIAMLSYSNFGSETSPSSISTHEAIERLHKEHPEIVVDGEMQVTFALNRKLRDKKYPFSTLNGKKVNTLVFPNINSANITYKMLVEMGVAQSIGPIQLGLNKPIHILDVESSVQSIVNMTAIAVLDAIVEEQRSKAKEK